MFVKVNYNLRGLNVIEEFEGYPNFNPLIRAIEKCEVSNVHIDMALNKEDLV